MTITWLIGTLLFAAEAEDHQDIIYVVENFRNNGDHFTIDRGCILGSASDQPGWIAEFYCHKSKRLFITGEEYQCIINQVLFIYIRHLYFSCFPLAR